EWKWDREAQCSPSPYRSPLELLVLESTVYDAQKGETGWREDGSVVKRAASLPEVQFLARVSGSS
ncbi:hypothetical protein ACQP3C_30345, partial [Escherichia coli]